MTGVLTGCDMRTEITLPEQMWGLLGQQITSDDKLVFVTKTHFPFNVFKTEEHFTANKMIVIVRNPLDVLPSFATLTQTKGHSAVVNEQFDIDFPDWWDNFITAISENMAKSHEFVFRQISEKIPTYVIRYEDLKLNPEKGLRELMCFLLDVESIEGTVVESQLTKVIS